jgi:hypothetical protein
MTELILALAVLPLALAIWYGRWVEDQHRRDVARLRRLRLLLREQAGQLWETVRKGEAA